jgi:serine/threonine protein kinase
MKLHKHLTFTLRHKDVEQQPVQKPTGERRVNFQEPNYHVRSDSMQSNGVRVQPDSPTWRSFHTAAGRPKLSDLPPDTEVFQEEKYGRHGDINPGNILWYHGSSEGSATHNGTLKIADFGQAELNTLKSKTRQRDVANTMTYRPPECDSSPTIIRQSYDIWCLGCVYLEFIAWMLGGEVLLTQFGLRRRAKDRYLNNEVTDTFFEFVSNPDTAEVEVKIKSVVIMVRDTTRLRKLLLPLMVSA